VGHNGADDVAMDAVMMAMARHHPAFAHFLDGQKEMLSRRTVIYGINRERDGTGLPRISACVWRTNRSGNRMVKGLTILTDGPDTGKDDGRETAGIDRRPDRAHRRRARRMSGHEY
jgi:hypothetical protein